jgi:hypothetical protein
MASRVWIFMDLGSLRIIFGFMDNQIVLLFKAED